MTLRFKRTADEAPHMFASREHADTDWLLYCGAWQVGRIHESRKLVEPRIVFVWSLTGPHTPEARVPMRGEAPTVSEAKKQLVDAMRGWAVWAGLRSSDDSAPPEPHWVQEDEGWLLISGELRAGRVNRDLHWMLVGMSPTQHARPARRQRGQPRGGEDEPAERVAGLARMGRTIAEKPTGRFMIRSRTCVVKRHTAPTRTRSTSDWRVKCSG